MSVPKRVFIVPYRNRVQHKFFFSKYMSFILEDSNDYEIFFSHQCDTRTFNRGAMKNIGFLAVKEKYPNDYRNITFIFNDVDTIPFNKIFDYDTDEGTVKHYYGYKYALGGIVVMKGSDFEKVNGYPCFWGWGMEDNCLQKRCLAHGLKIDRSTFYAIGSPQILQLFDGISRIISKKDPWRMHNDNGLDGLKAISGLQFSIQSNSLNANDNLFTVNNPRIFFINATAFQCLVPFSSDHYTNYDLREPQRKVVNPNVVDFQDKNTKKRVNFVESDWTQIPYYPTKKERREEKAQSLLKQGMAIPHDLAAEMEKDLINEIKGDAYNSNIDVQIPPVPGIQYKTIHQRAHNQNQQAYKHQTQASPRNPYDPYWNSTVKPKAQASARIRLGGVY